MKKLLVVLFIFAAAGVFAHQKFALVIGNGNYTNTTKLNNPVNDANDMAAALQGLGFTVDRVLNGTQDQMVNAIMQLKRRLSASRNSYGFLFYAGHGVQSAGENFLIPVDANIPTENFLRNRSVSVQEMLDELNDAGNEFNVVVLDACRNNPFSWARSGSRGLTVVGSQPADSIIVFATAAGSTASDGTGRNGLFTQHLLNNLKTSGLEVTEIFRRTGADVARASNNQQRPAVYNQFYGTAYLGARPVAATPAQPAQTPRPAPAATTPAAPPQQPAYKIGDRGPGGGFIFTAEGGIYMECSLDLGEHTWDQAISAAQNYKGGGFTDWRLPTKDELNLMYVNLKAKNLGGLGNDYYWSSSRDSGYSFGNYYYVQRFSDGSQAIYGKGLTSLVRAVRAF
jgi:hypothetical protein